MSSCGSLTVLEPFTQDDVVGECRGLSAKEVEPTESVTVNYAVINNSSRIVNYVLSVTADGQQVASDSGPTVGAGSTHEDSVSFVPADEGLTANQYELSADVTNASPTRPVTDGGVQQGVTRLSRRNELPRRRMAVPGCATCGGR